ncbi:MAG: hypothetical protein OIF50_12830 [Flavobacteriaceae bacterium]|nr:hypothetical protein [Flavobacteriaceae bacterium]
MSKNQIGNLHKDTAYKTIDSLFINDSVVHAKAADYGKLNSSSSVSIFRDGKELMKISPSSDSIPKIGHVQILDNRFATDKGIGLASTFKDVQKHYTVNNIINSLNNLVVFIAESDLYFTIDKKELPENLRYNMGKIEAIQIPNDAKIKYLMIGWGE